MLQDKGLRIRLLVLHSVTHFNGAQLTDLIRGKHVFVVEEACSGSGISEAITMGLQSNGLSSNVHALDLGKDFVPHGHISCLYHQTGLDCESIADYMYEVLHHEN